MPYRRQLALRKLTSRTNSRSPAPSTSSGLASPHCSVTKSPAMLTKTDCGPAAYAVATRIRPFSPKDIPEVVDLHKRVFPGNPFSSSELEIHFRLLFFENPWYDADLPSLVYQEQGEKICGFYGVIPRRMRMQGRPIRAVVSAATFRTNGFFCGTQTQETVSPVRAIAGRGLLMRDIARALAAIRSHEIALPRLR